MNMNLKARTNASYRGKNIIVITVIALLACLSVVMTVYNLIKGNYLLLLAWLIAAVLASTYVFIRINTVFATYLATDRESLYMRNWKNDFLPYDYDNKIKLLSEFIPAKTKLTEIPLAEIKTVLIGTKNFIKRNVSADNAFVKKVKPLEVTKDFYRKKTVSSMDIIYVETYDNECGYMPIVKFDTADVVKIVQLIGRINPDLTVRTSGREYRRLLAK